jgi:hypothetical protein
MPVDGDGASMKTKLLLGLAAFAFLAIGQAAAHARPHVGIVVAPPVVVETPPPPPYAGAVWVEGYWDPALQVWVPGHHEHARPGWVYEHHGWRRVPAGYAFVRGHWRRI